MLTLDPTDTIAAVASPPGGGLRGLVRLTGPEALGLVLRGFERADGLAPTLPERPVRWAGRLAVAGLRRPLAATVNLWPGGRTATGQPLAEVQTTGSPPILAALLGSFLRGGARLAEPGEFTLRGFLAGRIDLTQAEAVLGVIDAGTPEQLHVALRQLAGGLAGPLVRLRDDLADTLAHLEANLDFADEADVDPLGRTVLAAQLGRQADELAKLASRLEARTRPTSRPRVVLVGPPNAGKSGLFNALIGRNAAIVTAVAGTTRDYLEAECQCDGLVVVLVDTAGIEATSTPIEIQAQVARTHQRQVADLVLGCLPGDLHGWGRDPAPASCPSLAVGTKADLRDQSSAADGGLLWTSATTGAGLAELRVAIAQVLRQQEAAGSGAAVAATAARSRAGLASAAQALAAAARAVKAEMGDEWVAVDLRQALDDLGRIVGAVVTEDLLGRIFQRFCIGK